MADPALPAFSSNQQSSFERADHLKSTFSYEAQAMMQHHAQLIADAEKLNKDLEVLRAQHSDVERALRVCNVKIAELQQHLATVHQMMGMVQAGAPDNEQNNILRHLNQNIPHELATLEADKHQKEQERGRIIRNIQEIERTRQKYVKQAEIAESKARQMQAEAQLKQQQQQQLSQAAARHIKKEEPEDDGDNEATRIVEISKTGDTLGMTICKTSHSPVFIAHILPNGPAAQQGGPRAGDEILKVNGASVDGMSKGEVLKILKEVEGTVVLEVRNNKELIADNI